MSNLAAALRDRGLKLAAPDVIKDCEDVIRQFSLSVDEFIDSAESATFAANAQMLTKTAVEGIRANWSKKAATRGVRPGGPMGMKTPGPGANRFDRSNADGMPGFSATSTATPAGQMAGAKRPYGDVSGSSAARSGGGFSATSSAVPPGARTGGGNFASPPATAARPGAAAGARPAGAGAGSSAAAAPPAAGAGSASGPDAYYSRKNRGEVLETYTPTSAIAQAAAAAATPGSPLAAGGTTDAGLNEAAMAAAANKPYTRPSVQTLRGLGYRTFRNISELVRGSGASGSSKAATLAATEPLPLVVPSLTKWAEVTGMRVGLPPLPAPPVTADSGSGGAAAASPAGSTSPQQLGGASGSPLSNTSPGSTGAGAGAGAGSSPPSAAAGLDTSFTSVDGSGGGADDAAVGPPPDTRRFELPAQRSVEGPYQYMYTTLAKRAEALEERLAEVGDAILEAHGLAGLLEPLGTVSQSPLVYVGRVVVDGEGKINATSVLLEGTAADPLPGGVASRNPFLKCGRILLDLRDVPAFSLFPGQVVAVKGLNTSGDKMVVQQVYTAAPLPLPVTPVDNMRVLADAASSSIDRAGPLRMVVAAGPYTLAADWKFSPLADMLAAVAVPKAGEPPPDVIVLMGPFVDAEHPAVKGGGDIFLEDEDGRPMPLTYEQIWTEQIAPILEEFLSSDYLKRTHLVLVPHTGDMTTHPAYPQWPVSSSPAGERDGHLDAFLDPSVRRRVTAVANPSTFVVGGVVVAATSADILFALNGEDTTRQPPSAGPGGPPRVERLPRMAQHVLEQRYFYPLFPAAPDTPLELSQLAATALPLSPDLLLLPSKLKQFTRPLLGGTLAVNPGTLCRANAGGSYAKLLLFPPTRGAMVTQDVPTATIEAGDVAEGEPTTYAFHSLPQRTRVDIVRV